MRLPKKIEISGYLLAIELKDKIIVNGEECFGVYDNVKKKISLVKGMAPARKKEIFIHEFLHFLEDIYRIDISEEGVSSMAMGILQLINNKKINLE